MESRDRIARDGDVQIWRPNLRRRESPQISLVRAMPEEVGKRRGLRSAVIVERVVREQLRAMACERLVLSKKGNLKRQVEYASRTAQKALER